MYKHICQLDYEYHALCLISDLFLRNLHIFFQLHKCEVSEGSTRLMLLLFTTWSPATLQASCAVAAEDCYLGTLCVKGIIPGYTFLPYLGRKQKICSLKSCGHRELSERQYGCAKAQRKPHVTSCSCTYRTGTCVLCELIQMYVCIVTELNCPSYCFASCIHLLHFIYVSENCFFGKACFLECHFRAEH